MTPKILKTDNEYWKARRHLVHLKAKGSDPETASEIELWQVIIDDFEKGRLAESSPFLRS